MRKIQDFVRSIERSKTPVWYWVVGAYVVIMVRNLLESVLERQGDAHLLGLTANFDDSLLRYFIHYPASYLAGVLTVAMILHLLSGERIERTVKFAIAFLWVICLVPLADAIISGGKGYPIGYFRDFAEMKRGFLYFAWPTVSLGEHISPGIRLEIVLYSLGASLYVLVKAKSILRAVAAALLTYSGILIVVGSLPVLFAAAMQVSVGSGLRGRASAVRPEGVLALINLTVLSALILFCYRRYSREKFHALIRNVRPFRTAHFCVLLLAGGMVGYYGITGVLQPTGVSPADYFAVFALCVGMLFACQSAAVVNDIFDVAADRESNPTRPLAKGTMGRDEYLTAGAVFLALALAFAFSASYYSFILVLTFWALYFVYSAPPFRLKRIFPINMLLIVANGLVAFLAGAALFGQWNTFASIPAKAVLLITVPYALTVHIITLKDVEADRKAHVHTLPVLLGERWGRGVLAFLTLAAFLCVALILGIAWLYMPGLVFGLLGAMLILRKKWSERLYFTNYACFFLVVALGLLRTRTVA